MLKRLKFEKLKALRHYRRTPTDYWASVLNTLNRKINNEIMDSYRKEGYID